jgi:predicted dinucleotide-binding enzyme
MKIGILGSGTVGQTLGAGLAAHGYAVMLGTRDPSQEKVREWVQNTGHGVTAGTFGETASFGELIVIATLFGGTKNALELATPAALKDKIVIDATNPLEFTKAGPTLAAGFDDSAGERIQKQLPESKVVKAWNIVTAKTMVDPVREEGVPDMFIAGNDAEAKVAVTKLLQEFGWPVIDVGGIEGARMLESLGMLWIRYGIDNKQWTHAFKLLKK